MSKGKQPHSGTKERGALLTIWLILMILDSIFSSYLIYYLRQQQQMSSPAWIWTLLVAVAAAKIVAAVGIWFWRKWGLWLYAISVAGGIVAGLALTASQLIVFHDVIPLLITGYLVKDKRPYFE